MATIGHIRADGEGFKGYFCTLTVSRDIEFRPNRHKRCEQHPDLIIYFNEFFDIGAAWWKVDEKRGRYLFCRIATPEFDRPILFTIDPIADKPGLLALSWTPTINTPARKP